MINCSQPDCTGTVEDGYCVECGMEPTNHPLIAPGASSGRCNRPGCAGLVEDGYCTTCGHPPLDTAAPATAGNTPSPLSGPSGPSGPSGAVATGSTATAGSIRTGSGRSSSSGGRGMLGAGMVEVPRVPYRDPATAVLSNPEIPEKKRFCRNGHPVGRARPGRPGRTEGFCPQDGTPYSFTPKLGKGDMVGGQYEVLGCLAHGGLGWVYLGRDRNVSDRWVVLKGLLDAEDADVFIAERTFLAAVEHPNIVKIHNFVRHAGEDYIVMEYIGGRSLRDILEQRRRDAGPTSHLPLPQVIAYGLEILRALGYLHDQGMVYCDFKPDNAIQSEEQLKLIDLGGVRRIDDEDSDVYGTPGYQAPEIAAGTAPSISSDLYTVGRSLAVLSFPFGGFTTKYIDSLPPRASVPLLAAYESYDRLLRRATHADPVLRFQSAADMAEQLTGVLREVLSAEDGRPRPAPSPLFGPAPFTSGPAIVDMVMRADGPVLGTLSAGQAATALPVPLVDDADRAAGYLAGLPVLADKQLAAALDAAPTKSPEVELALVRVRIALGDLPAADHLLDGLAEARPADWRISWYRAVAALAAGADEDVQTAAHLFDLLYSTLPGEDAPKLALAYCRELRGDLAGAAGMYEVVWRTDNSCLSAGFGLARARFAAGDRAGAIRALDSVPPISGHYTAAQVAAAAMSVRGRPAAELTEQDLLAAAARLDGLGLEGGRYERLAAEVLEAALGLLSSGPAGGPSLLGAEFAERPLRRRLEETYRTLARHAGGKRDRVVLVGRANAVRPRTLF
jgi:serine/threonine-protein kinase PknG